MTTATLQSITADLSALVAAVEPCAETAKTRTPIPVLSCVRLTSDDGKLTAYSSNGEISIACTVHQVDLSGRFIDATVNATSLVNALRHMVGSTVKLSIAGGGLELSSVDSEYVLPLLMAESFPPDQAIESDPTATMPGRELSEMLKSCVPFFSRVSSQHGVNGALLAVKGTKLFVSATNGRSMILRNAKLSGETSDCEIIIPGDAVKRLIRLCDTEDEDVVVRHEGGIARLSMDHWWMSTTLINGQFPPVFDVIPKDAERSTEVVPSKLIAALESASVMTSEETRGVTMQVSKDGITVRSSAKDVGRAVVAAEIDNHDGEEFEIAFDPGQVIAALRQCGDFARIETTRPNKPIKIVSADASVVAVAMALKKH